MYLTLVHAPLEKKLEMHLATEALCCTFGVGLAKRDWEITNRDKCNSTSTSLPR